MGRRLAAREELRLETGEQWWASVGGLWAGNRTWNIGTVGLPWEIPKGREDSWPELQSDMPRGSELREGVGCLQWKQRGLRVVEARLTRPDRVCGGPLPS